MNTMAAMFSSWPAQQQGGIPTWVWIILILVIVILLLWWLGRQEDRRKDRKETPTEPPAGRTGTFETTPVSTRGGEVPPPIAMPVVEEPPETVMPHETETVQTFEPGPDLVVDRQEAEETVEAINDAAGTKGVEYAPPEAPPAESIPGPVEGFPDLGIEKPGPAQLDNLEIIEGIGPRIASVLRAAGVDTYAQLAEMQPAEITRILQSAGVRLADPATWPEQARLAMEGKWDEFKALTDSLRGGRRSV